jgi:hypothetical protein
MKHLFSLPALALSLIVAACGGSSSSGSGRNGLILSQSPFAKGVPAHATMLLLRPPQAGGEDTSWVGEKITDSSNQVFHKAMHFKPASGGDGILTIGATKGKDNARFKYWKKGASGWEGEVIWEGGFGGKQDRTRDMEVADVNGDGVDDIVVVTHDQGVVMVFEQKGGKYEMTEIDRTEGKWIHEVEVGDVNGDGVIEFFATPSDPNQLSGEHQAGEIVMYRYNGSGYDKTLIEAFETRHVKEVLCYDLENSGRPQLFAALEGEGIGGSEGGAGTMIKRYVFEEGKSEPTQEEMMELPGKLCRFLNGGDTNGDGTREIVASTSKNGVHTIFKEGGEWQRKEIVSGRLSSSFEHATLLMDWDQDGADDVFVGSDNKKTYRRFSFNKDTGRYVKEDVHVLTDVDSLFTWGMMPLPAGM